MSVSVYTDLATHEKDIEAWAEEQELNLSAKQHKKLMPLRGIEAVSADILQLERESDGLIHDILSLA